MANGFLKPTESQRHNRQFGTKGFFVTSRDQARRLVDQATADGITFMLQEWIPGEPAKTILIDGFVDRDGKIPGMVARRRVRMDPPRLANTCSDVTIPLADVSGCLPALHTVLSAVNHRGVFNVEFKFDARDGQFKIIEVNPRPFWLIGHIAKAGLDLPWMSYLDASELPVPRAGAIPDRSLRDVRDPRCDGHRARLELVPPPGWPRPPNVADRGPGALLVEGSAAGGQRHVADPGAEARSPGWPRQARRRASGRRDDLPYALLDGQRVHGRADGAGDRQRRGREQELVHAVAAQSSARASRSKISPISRPM